MLKAERFNHYGKGVKIWPLAHIAQPEAVWLGDHVMIDDFAFIIGGKGVWLRDYSHVCAYVSILGNEEMELGEFSGIGTGSRVFTATENYDTMVTATVPVPYRAPHRAPVRIGRHVTIGANSVVLPGSVICDGAVIGALSLVKGTIPPWQIWAGIPARFIKERDKASVLEWERKFKESCM